MALTNDPRYDVLLIDSPDGVTANETLPLVLVENSGVLSYSEQMISPYAGQLASGDLQDRDLTRGTIKTQRNWQGGRGLLNAYTETNRYYDATADTRFTNAVLLPPEAKVGIATGDPDFLPTASGVSLAPVRLEAKFITNGRVDGNLSAKSLWYQNGRIDDLEIAKYRLYSRSTSQSYPSNAINTTNYVVGTNYNVTTVRSKTAVGFYNTDALTINQSKLYLSINSNYGTTASGVVSICEDRNGAIGGVVASGTITADATAQWQTVTFGSSASLRALTQYWLVLECSPTPVSVGHFTPSSEIKWHYDPENQTYQWAYRTTQQYTWDSDNGTPTPVSAWGPWENIATNGQYFIIGSSIGIGTPYYDISAEESVSLAQSFTTGGSSVSVTQAQLRVKTIQIDGGSTAKVRIRTHNALTNEPNATLATGTLTQSGTLAWQTVTLSASLSANTKYWLELYCESASPSANLQVSWSKDVGIGYSLGEAKSLQVITDPWSAVIGDFYFVINTYSSGAPKHYTLDKGTYTHVAQKFTVGAGSVGATSVTLRIGAVTWQGSPTLTLKVCADSGGSPGTVLSTKSLSNPGAMDWESVTLTGTVTLSAATSYWILLAADAPTGDDAIEIQWQCDTAGGYGARAKTYDGVAYYAANVDCYFTINGYSPGNIYFYNRYRSKQGLFQKFTTGASGVTASFVRIFAQMISGGGQGNITVQIWSDSAGSPGSLIGSAYNTLKRPDFDANSAITQKNWLKVPLIGAASLSATTAYWIFIGSDAPFVGDTMVCDVYVDSLAGYSGGVAKTRTNTDEWSTWTTGATTTYDIFFTINVGSSLGASVTANPQRFGSDWYVAAGTVIYKYVPGSNTWTAVKTAAASVTRLAAYGGKIYAALGDSTNMLSSSDGATWADVTGTWVSSTNPGNFRYTFLKAYNGFLYCLKWTGGGGTYALAYTNGTSWYNVSVASSEVTPRGLAGFMNEIMITSTTGLYSLSGDLVYQVSDWELEHAGDTGRNPVTWMADGQLYIPIRSGLNAFNGSRNTPAGLDLDEGLPAGEQGQVVAMAGSKSFLFAAVDANTDRSGIYAYNGAGWHCLAKATASGQRIRAIGLESVTSTAGNIRLWWFQEGVPYYMEMPAISDNPRDYTDMRYALTGYVTSCALGGELAQIPKDLNRVVVASENCTSAQTVGVYVDVDQANLWTLVGTVTQSPTQTLEISPADITPLLTGSGSTAQIIQTDADTLTGELTVGMFVRVGDTDVGQIETIDSDRQFTLAAPLRNGAPAAGVGIYGATPSGYEFRYRIVLNTTDPTKTPIVRRVSLKWQELLIDKGRFALAVRAEDQMDDRTGTRYPYGAAALRERLRNWSRRLTPSYLVEPDGGLRRVKITSYNVSGFGREEDKRSKTQRFRTRIDLTLDEA